MNIRKEQVLFGLVALLVLWQGSGYLGEPEAATARWAPGIATIEGGAVAAAPLADAEPRALLRRDFCTEPSETRPLPPRELAFPPRAPLTVVGLPIELGPDLGHSMLLAVDGATVDEPDLQLGGGGEPVAAGEGEAVPLEATPVAGQGMDATQAAKVYDRIWVEGQPNPYYGSIEPQTGLDLLSLEDRTEFAGLKLRMLEFQLSKNRIAGQKTFGVTGLAIARVRLADTLRNEVERRKRSVPDLPTTLAQRRELIDWLLSQARSEAWVYEEAQQQAELYLQLSGRSLDGLETMQKVMRVRGDLEGELALLQGIRGTAQEDAFRCEGLGVLQARLGLWLEAEKNLREGARLAPNDARPHGALAAFLLQRGRSREAMAAASRALQAIGSVQDDGDRARILRTILGCQLALGDLAAAGDTISLLKPEDGLAFARAALAYASADPEAALVQFRLAASGADSGPALLGQAACHLMAGKWQEAYDTLVRVVDQEPLLRHRASTGLALLFLRLGQFDTALGHVDRALEAAPDDAYALYLRGRTLRLMGQHAAAIEAFAATLGQRDDFVHAIAEMALAQAGQSVGSPATEQAAALLAARRYADRAVELAPRPSLELYELQGLQAFAAADSSAATEAFQAAYDLAGSEAGKAYAKGALAVIAYSRRRVDDAIVGLERLVRDLGRDDPLAKWSEATLVAIEDHAQKEMLGDGFDRLEPGAVWECAQDGSLKAKIRDGRLVFAGDFQRSSGGSGEVSVQRVGAVRQGKNFLAVSVQLQLGPSQDLAESFCGLGVQVARGRAGLDLSARLGLRDGKPYLELIDGRDGDREQRVQQFFEIAGFDRQKPAELTLRVVPRGEDSQRQLTLQAYWDGLLVFTHELKQLNANTSNELQTILFATGNRGSHLDVAFDDYRLERRKER